MQAAREPNGRERAIALLREATSLDKTLWEARYDLGVLLAQGGVLTEAEEQLAAAAKLAPDAPDVAYALGEVRRRRGENRNAADGLGDFLHAHPEAAEVRPLLVATLREAGLIDKALAEAREALVRRPADAAALSELSLCHLARGEKEPAQLVVRQALDVNPKSAAAHRAQGMVSLANGDDAAAFQSFLKASQEDPRDTTARMNMATVLLRAGAYAKAEEQYRAILHVVPDDADAVVGLAASLRGQNKVEEARAQLERALTREPHHVSALFNMGVLHADFLKKPELAQPFFQRFLEDAPTGHPARAAAERYVKSAAATLGAEK